MVIVLSSFSTGHIRYIRKVPIALILFHKILLVNNMCFFFNLLESRPTDCSALDKRVHKNGVYKIYPENGSMFRVYCDMVTDGGNWTVNINNLSFLSIFHHNYNIVITSERTDKRFNNRIILGVLQWDHNIYTALLKENGNVEQPKANKMSSTPRGKPIPGVRLHLALKKWVLVQWIGRHTKLP